MECGAPFCEHIIITICFTDSSLPFILFCNVLLSAVERWVRASLASSFIFTHSSHCWLVACAPHNFTISTSGTKLALWKKKCHRTHESCIKRFSKTIRLCSLSDDSFPVAFAIENLSARIACIAFKRGICFIESGIFRFHLSLYALCHSLCSPSRQPNIYFSLDILGFLRSSTQSFSPSLFRWRFEHFHTHT